MKQFVSSAYNSLLPFNIRNLIYRNTKLKYYQKARLSGKGDKLLQCFDRHKCIFIHIPKTGGISIKKSLFSSYSSLPHLLLDDYKIIFGETLFKNYFKFSFVRNPWDRVLSAYIFLKKGGYSKKDKNWSEQHLSEYNQFEDFVKYWLNDKNIYTQIHFVPQYLFVCNQNLIPEIDFIGHFENLEQDFIFVQNRMGISLDLQHLNKSSKKATNYQEFYTDHTREIVSKVYAQDIEIFGYDFEKNLIN